MGEDMPNDHFSDGPIRSYIIGLQQQMVRQIDSLTGDDLQNSNLESLQNALVQQYWITIPQFDESNIRHERYEKARPIIYGSRTVTHRGTIFVFYVPYEGDENLFYYYPGSSYATVGDGIEVAIQGNELVFTIWREADLENATRASHAISSSFKYALSIYQGNVQRHEKEVGRYNNELATQIAAQIQNRLKKLQTDEEISKSLGYPLRERPDNPHTFEIPAIRQRIAKQELNSSRQKPLSLSMANYEQILMAIQSMAQIMEYNPSAFSEMDEETLRTLFLVPLNLHFTGDVSGETFNFAGKSDILIKHKGKNIFVAECKFWKGPKSFHDAIGQLMNRYVSWHDTKTAILLFNRNGNFSRVLKQIPEIVEKHSLYRSNMDSQIETQFRFMLAHPSDPEQEVMLTVMAFEVPNLGTE